MEEILLSKDISHSKIKEKFIFDYCNDLCDPELDIHELREYLNGKYEYVEDLCLTNSEVLEDEYIIDAIKKTWIGLPILMAMDLEDTIMTRQSNETKEIMNILNKRS